MKQIIHFAWIINICPDFIQDGKNIRLSRCRIDRFDNYRSYCLCEYILLN